MHIKRASYVSVARIYLILPLTLLVVFIFFYRSWGQAELVAREQREAQVRLEEEQTAAKRQAMEQQMAAESQRLRDLRERAQFEKELAEVTERENKIKELEESVSTSSRQLKATEVEVADYKARLDQVRKERFAAEKEVFDRSVEVEKLRVQKNTTDLEYQRLSDMVLETVTAAPMP